MIKKTLFISLLAIGFGQCKTQTSTAPDTTSTKQTYQKAPSSRGVLSVIAEVIETKPINTETGNTLCDDLPCEATIKIKEITNKGSYFKGEVTEGQSIEVFFVKSLSNSKTTNTITSKTELKPKDQLKADIIYSLKETTVSKYQVVKYETL